MPGAFLHKKTLLDQFKDDYRMVNPIKARRTERQWENPIVRHKREKGVQDWAKSFAGKRHYRKLTRFNAMRSEAYTEKTAWTYLEELGKLEGEESRMEAAEKVLKALGCKPGTEGHWYGKDGDEVDIIDVLDNTEWAFAQKVCGQLQESVCEGKDDGVFVQINSQGDYDRFIKAGPAGDILADGGYGLGDIEGCWWEIAPDDHIKVPARRGKGAKYLDRLGEDAKLISVAGGRLYITEGVRRYIEDDLGVDLEDYGLEAEEWESKKSETLSYEKGNKNSHGEDAPWVIRDHKGGKVLASFAKKADAEAHLERMQRYSKSESAVSDRAAAIKDAIADAARATGLANKIVLSATNMPKLFIDVYQGGIMGDGINWEVTGNLSVRRFDKQDVKRAWHVDSLEELEKSFESEFQQLKDGKFGQAPKSESLKTNFRFKDPKSDDDLIAIQDIVYEINRRDGGQAVAEKIGSELESLMERASRDPRWDEMSDEECASAMYKAAQPILSKITSEQLEEIFRNPGHDHDYFQDAIEYDEEAEAPEYRADDLYDFSSIRHESLKKALHESRVKKLEGMGDWDLCILVARNPLAKDTYYCYDLDGEWTPHEDNAHVFKSREAAEKAVPKFVGKLQRGHLGGFAAWDPKHVSIEPVETQKKAPHESSVKKLEAFSRPYHEDIILQILDQANNTYSNEDLEGKTVAELEEIYSELINLADAAKHEKMGEIVFEPVVDFKPQQYAVYEIDNDGDELECIFSGTLGGAKRKLEDAIGDDPNKKFHVVAIAYTPRGQLADSEVVWSDLKQEPIPARHEAADEGSYAVYFLDDETGRVSKDGEYPTWRKAYTALGDGTVWDEGSSNNFVFHGNHLQQIYKYKKTGRTGKWSGNGYDVIFDREISEDPADYIKAHFTPTRYNACRFSESVEAGITSRDVQAAARSAWSTSGAKDFKLDIVRLGDHVIIYAKGPNGEDDIGISWHVHIPGGTNSYKTPHVEQFADWGSDKHEPERTYDAKDLDDLEDFLLDEFKALQETLDVTKENM